MKMPKKNKEETDKNSVNKDNDHPDNINEDTDRNDTTTTGTRQASISKTLTLKKKIYNSYKYNDDAD